MTEHHKRSFMKGMSWRIFATLTTMVIVFSLTGKIFLSFTVGLVEVITKIILYYVHERVWNYINWGRSHT